MRVPNKSLSVTRMSRANRHADSVDIYAGQQLRRRRKELKLTQQQLSQILGISSQQIQKYEAGLNRIGIGRLFSICKALSVTPSYFFAQYQEPLPGGDVLEGHSVAEPLYGILEGNEAKLLRIFRHIKSDALRGQVFDLLKSFSEEK